MTDKISNIITGLNHCLIRGDSLDLIAKSAGVDDVWKTLKSGYDNLPDRADSLGNKLAEMLKGENTGHLLDNAKIEYNPGVREFFAGNQLNTCMITSSVNLIADKVANDLGLDVIISNELESIEGILTGNHKTKITLENKFVLFGRHILENNIRLRNIMYIGIDNTDVDIMSFIKQNGGHPVTFMPQRNKSLYKYAIYSFSDFRELNEYINQVNELILAKREYLNIVRVLVKDDKDRILLVKEGREPSKGEWNLPGGRVKVRNNEDAECAAVREVLEETGVDIRIGGAFGHYFRDGQIGDRISKIAYSAIPSGSFEFYNIRPINPNEIEEAKIFDVRWVLDGNPLNIKDYRLELIRDGMKRITTPADYYAKEQDGKNEI